MNITFPERELTITYSTDSISVYISFLEEKRREEGILACCARNLIVRFVRLLLFSL